MDYNQSNLNSSSISIPSRRPAREGERRVG